MSSSLQQHTPSRGLLEPELFVHILGRELQSPLDLGELSPIIEPGSAQSMQINAGAGTGKTTALTAKCLYAVYVEGLDPESIVATTFTQKAARELQSRIISLGEQMVKAAREHISPDTYQNLRFVDLNAIITGTLDGIVQDTLQKYKEPMNPPPLPIEDFVAKGLLLRRGLFPQQRFKNPDLETYIKQAVGPPQFGSSRIRWLVDAIYDVRTYCVVNDVDINRYTADARNPGAQIAFDAIQDFDAELTERRLADYLAFNRIFLEKLTSGALDHFTTGLKLLLVDEYQDTEYLQERIYFELADRVLDAGGALVVVGDDDQALYRFRHATVDLFVRFAERFAARFEGKYGAAVIQRSLVTNRRSTRRIISYCNDYLRSDPEYQGARTNKPALEAPPGAVDGDPVFVVHEAGNDARPLAARVARIISEVVEGGWTPTAEGSPILLDPRRGSPGDMAVIAQTVREKDGSGLTFIGHLRRELDSLGGPKLFNPRGRELSDIPEVTQLLGLLILAIDPDANLQPTKLPREIASTLSHWRQQGEHSVDELSPPAKIDPLITLRAYIDSFRRVRGQGAPKKGLIVSEILYRLATWLPFFHDDIEGLAYLELLQRGIVQAQPLGDWSCRLVFDGNGVIGRSVEEIYWNYIVPMAAGEVDVDEDLLVTLPRDRVPALTIHQAKGLEYPLVVVDVGSRIKDRRSKEFHRWPSRELDRQNRLRATFAAFGNFAEQPRTPRDERFDDLVRKFFVAFSRAGQILVLCAHSGGFVVKRVENVATWFDRQGNWAPNFHNHVEVI
jgi:ATP-dependent DNA helicase UvrD/PcrA